MIFPVDWLQIGDQKVQIDAVVYFLWSIWNGWIMATVGAFGGIMAGFGHISVLGLGAKASSLKGMKATVNGKEVDSGKYLSDNIRLSNS
ncbi:MAG: sulfite exporter TauE/SafE family protein, partial [Thermodesulfobium sp.]